MSEQEQKPVGILEDDQTEVVTDGVHHFSSDEKWTKPEDPAILEQLEWFRDQKLGLMMHWGIYSQIGLVESWALIDEDEEWSRNEVDWDVSSAELKQQYFDLNKSFNPLRFQPDQWADLAKESGFKYLIFTTKHHDGYCMWDTKTTDYRVTGPESPYKDHKYADITKHVFDAFRDKGLAIAAYFSKADWHTPYYWPEGMERSEYTRRGPSYDPAQHPELWEKFVQFTHEQMMELLTDYGRIDILWLDAGWVRDGGKIPQDIRLGELVDRARETQPWLLSADRTVGGAYENYITPEQTIPEKVMDVPWESCITLGSAFSFRYEDTYKSLREVVHILLEIVAKGGNLALNIAPQPDGRLPKGAVQTLKELGTWMETYSEAIYGTRICAPYFGAGFAFTCKGNSVYAAHLYEDENVSIHADLLIPYTDKQIHRVTLLSTGEELVYEQKDAGILVRIPSSITEEQAPPAHIFKLEY
ncbi:alpha-L-fucosidase [Paenibacillus sp. Marseille-Q4541]|uniref:alpha-L-fucosidase n=1 Tax=Paenibacillus sp. Marseille-Q4541 TaxID=2831522 RepID=UPI001BA8D2F3